MLNLFGGKNESCGSITTGGTESIFISMLCYREVAKEKYGIKCPEILTDESIHPAFDKAAYYLGMKVKKLKLDKNCQISAKRYIKNISKDTIVIALTGIDYPHGMVRPAKELNDLLIKKNSWVLIHIDSCMGGYITSMSKYI